MNSIEIDEVTNILLNLNGGLHPYHLCEEEVDLLKNEYGDDWLEELGYTKLWLSSHPI